MTARDILAILLHPESDEPVLRAAEMLAARSNGSLVAAYLTALPEEPVAYEPTVVAGVWADLLNRARREGEKTRAAVEARLARSTQKWELRSAEALSRDLGRAAAVHARYADIAVVRRPAADDSSDLQHDLIEGVLFHSGRPALVIPPRWAGQTIGKRALLAWDASREATRALAESDWLVEGCEEIAVVTVDAKPRAFGHGEHPGGNIAAHLGRKGLKTVVRNIEAAGRPAAAIQAEAAAFKADLVIMGAYAHARLRELVFGGATRDMLEAAETPLLMAH